MERSVIQEAEFPPDSAEPVLSPSAVLRINSVEGLHPGYTFL
jgi:hypothetical protein